MAPMKAKMDLIMPALLPEQSTRQTAVPARNAARLWVATSSTLGKYLSYET